MSKKEGAFSCRLWCTAGIASLATCDGLGGLLPSLKHAPHIQVSSRTSLCAFKSFKTERNSSHISRHIGIDRKSSPDKVR